MKHIKYYQIHKKEKFMTNSELQTQVEQALEEEVLLEVEMDIIHIVHQTLEILETQEIFSLRFLEEDLVVKEQILEEIMDHVKVKI